jgi:hypothetical protein
VPQITSESVWLVVFTAQSEDETKTKGVNKEKCRKVEGEMDAAASELSPLGIKVPPPFPPPPPPPFLSSACCPS